MRSFEFNTIEESYPELLKALLIEGEEVSPRGMLTKEITPVGITINNPRKRIISNPVRRLNYGFMNAEFLWMLRGSNDVHEIAHYNRQWLNFTDDGNTLNGAYGQRIFAWDGLCDIWEESWIDDEGNPHTDFKCEHIVIDQFQKAYEQLLADKDSRQATIILFNPVQDYRVTKDKPCTNILRFSIRNNKLNMTAFMRSNDIMKGYPYDIYNFTMMQEIMAGKLGIEMGKYTHIADSLHIYEDDFGWAQDIIDYQENILYKDQLLLDARVSESNLYNEMNKVFDIESLTRLQSDIVKVEVIKKMLEKFENEYWKSVSALIATYNFRKAGREQFELDQLKEFITNEFKDIPEIQNWKPLAKK